MSHSQLNETAHLQVEQIDGLVAAAGVDGAREIMDVFLRSTNTLLDQLAAQIAEPAMDDATATAHALKGSAANVGAARLAATSSLVETACKDGDIASARAGLEAAREDFEAFSACFENHLSKS